MKQRSLGSQILWVWVPGMGMSTGMGTGTKPRVQVRVWVPCLGYGYIAERNTGMGTTVQELVLGYGYNEMGMVTSTGTKPC